jgi:hypothetical protein
VDRGRASFARADTPVAPAEPPESNKEQQPMRIPTWRLAFTGVAITILAIAGIGFATASNAPALPAANVTAAEQTAAPGSSAKPRDRIGGLREGWTGARLLRAGRHLVHVEATVTDRDGQLVVIHIDHGTVQSVGGGKLTIAEAGGGSETVSTSDATIVHVGRKDGSLADVTVGDEVFVQSRVDDGTTLARRILIVPSTGS